MSEERSGGKVAPYYFGADDLKYLRDLAAKVEALAEEYDERSRDTEDGERYPWGVAADDLRALLADALPQDADSEPASVPTTAREGGNGQDHAGEHQWMTRGHLGDEWRECFLCGKQEDV